SLRPGGPIGRPARAERHRHARRWPGSRGKARHGKSVLQSKTHRVFRSSTVARERLLRKAAGIIGGRNEVEIIFNNRVYRGVCIVRASCCPTARRTGTAGSAAANAARGSADRSDGLLG